MTPPITNRTSGSIQTASPDTSPDNASDQFEGNVATLPPLDPAKIRALQRDPKNITPEEQVKLRALLRYEEFPAASDASWRQRVQGAVNNIRTTYGRYADPEKVSGLAQNVMIAPTAEAFVKVANDDEIKKNYKGYYDQKSGVTHINAQGHADAPYGITPSLNNTMVHEFIHKLTFPKGFENRTDLREKYPLLALKYMGTPFYEGVTEYLSCIATQTDPLSYTEQVSAAWRMTEWLDKQKMPKGYKPLNPNLTQGQDVLARAFFDPDHNKWAVDLAIKAFDAAV